MSGFPAEGGCDCRAIRYRVTAKPMFVHCCHCRWCQRETGSAFVLNALVERDRVELLAGTPEVIVTPHVSGVGPGLWARVCDQFGDNLARFLAGEPLENVVDKRSGY